MRGLALMLLIVLVGGCATASTMPAPADVAGRWVGTWFGSGAFLVPRDEDVMLDLAQAGGVGSGRLVMYGAIAAEPVPDAIRDSGMAGIRVIADVLGNRVRLRHELGSELFDADLQVLGDRMVGIVHDTDPVMRLVLTREKPRAAVAPPVAAPGTAARSSPATPPAPPAETVVPPEAPRRSAPPPAEFSAVTGVRTVYFDFDRADIRPDGAAILDANAEWLRANPSRLALIEGHCDERGTAEYNLALGERRALAAKTYLVGRGVAEGRLTVTSYGLERPVCTDHDEACWARNRRAAFLIK